MIPQPTDPDTSLNLSPIVRVFLENVIATLFSVVVGGIFGAIHGALFSAGSLLYTKLGAAFGIAVATPVFLISKKFDPKEITEE